MKFRSERYPALVIHDGQKALARFTDGAFETDDPELAERLRRRPDLVEVDPPAPKPAPAPKPKPKPGAKRPTKRRRNG